MNGPRLSVQSLNVHGGVHAGSFFERTANVGTSSGRLQPLLSMLQVARKPNADGETLA